MGGTWPLIYVLTTGIKFNSFYHYHRYFIIGIVFFIILSICIWFIRLLSNKYQFVCRLFLTSLSFILILIPLIEWIYYIRFKAVIGFESIFAIYTTTYSEALSYILGTFDIYFVIACGIFLLLIFSLIFKAYSIKTDYINCRTSTPYFKLRVVGLLLIIAGLIFYANNSLFPNINITRQFLEVRSVINLYTKYSEFHHKNINNIKVLANDNITKKLHGSFIFVIGETGNKEYFQAYNHKLGYNTTPWMNMIKNNPNFIFFDKAYASFPQTVPALQYALTEANQYNGVGFFDGINIIDIARMAGYKVYWISNQGYSGKFNEGVTIIAKMADVAIFINEPGSMDNEYDEALLPELRKINPKENNFIILHTMGGHARYSDRYPENMNVFNADESNKKDSVEHYMNTVYYTDKFLQQVFDYSEAHLNLQGMIYFADHGENMKYAHTPEAFTFDMVRIPMWIYLSPNYEKTYPQTTQNLKNNSHKYFTNDMIYNLTASLLQVKTNNA